MPTSVLILDDEKDICEVIEDMLTGHVDRIRVVHRAEEALRLLETEKFDLIISDLMMPEMTGLEFLREMQKLRRHINIIVVSASDSDHHLAQALENGAMDFLSKPFTSEELLPIVKRIVAASKLHRT